jgi:hypothetical protein
MIYIVEHFFIETCLGTEKQLQFELSEACRAISLIYINIHSEQAIP